MAELSGAQWCARFPTSDRVEDLAPPFRECVREFHSALRTASAVVSVAATYRPLQRAYLMHWAWGIARGFPTNMCRPGDRAGKPIDPASVPPMAGVDINWAHGGNRVAAKAAAEAMVGRYGMKHCAALKGRHIDRRAIDQSISWNGTLAIRTKSGEVRKIASQPRTGANAELHTVGKTYGVIKLVSDPPHWSDDGR